MKNYSKTKKQKNGAQKSIVEQLNKVKAKKKEEYYIFKNSIINNSNDKNQVTNNKGLPKGTIAKIGDSIITGIMEEKILRKRDNVKERPYPISTMDDMNHQIFPILRKNPSHLIFLGTNDASLLTSR